MRRHAAIVDRHVMVLKIDIEWRVSHVSEAFCSAAGYVKDELTGQPLSLLQHPDNPETLFQDIWQVAMAGQSWSGSLIYRAKDGHPVWVETHIEPIWDAAHQNIVGYTAVDHDVSDKKRIEELSVTDHLTRLFNRLKLDEILKSEFVRAERFNSPLSCILLDVDYFKKVNDTWGHQVGDQVLIAVAQAVRSNIRKVDIAGRWGGEEFVIVSPETDAQGAAILAEKLRTSIQRIAFPPVENISCSFGVAQLRQGEGIEDLIRNADQALYSAKTGGRNRVEIHTKRIIIPEGETA
jgi:diguanylate cyclase (GGDEF)-like protein/PAS domain S-box-containing protein